MEKEKKFDLEKYRVGTLENMFYIPNFLNDDEKSFLWNKVFDYQWTTLPTTGRRLQEHGGRVEQKGTVAKPLPSFLAALSKRLFEEGLVSHLPNHVLINEYQKGQGIEHHTDGPLYTPNFAIISLGSALTLQFLSKIDPDAPALSPEERHVCSVLLEPGSLVLISGAAYTDYLHGIAKVEEETLDDKVVNISSALRGTTIERSLRVSLTIRHVKKTVSMNKLFGARK